MDSPARCQILLFYLSNLVQILIWPTLNWNHPEKGILGNIDLIGKLTWYKTGKDTKKKKKVPTERPNSQYTC